MTYVVTESCIKCKYTDCVDVCPVDCFREGPNMLVIDPDECIDCTLCVAECPVEAIFAEDDVPPDQRDFTALNADLAKVWPAITEKKAAPAAFHSRSLRGASPPKRPQHGRPGLILFHWPCISQNSKPSTSRNSWKWRSATRSKMPAACASRT